MRTRTNLSSLVAILAVVLAATPAFARGGGGGGHGGGGGGHGGGGGGHGGGGGGGHTGGHGGGGYFGGTPHVGGAFVGGGGVYVAPRTYGAWAGESYGLRHEMGDDLRFGPFGGLFGGYLYVGPNLVWQGEAHWGKGFWASGVDGWSWYAGQWWVSPAYPGWVWIGPPWVWDGQRMVSQEGYWTTAALPENGEMPGFVDPG